VSTYSAPLSDIRFILEVFDYEGKVRSLPSFGDFDIDTAMTMIEEMSRFCIDVFQPLNKRGDAVGVRYDPETHAVHMPEGFKEAYDGFRANGFTAIACDPTYGGLGAPFCLSVLAGEVLIASNKSLSMCSGLTAGLVDALTAHGSDEQKERLLPRLISGEWSGTMCLTEPHAGSDLGLITTKAVPVGDHFELTGTKIWITFGEQDMTDNIVHLVLARLPDAPPGIRGISTFVVPKFLDDGTRNGIHCGGTDHKMGIHASPTCVMNLEGAKGWLVGEPHRGMKSMFTMMNAARLNVGLEGVALSEAAYQAALAFSKDRRQGRSLVARKQDRNAEADNILVHPDVVRMLLNIKSTTEGLRGLAGWIAMLYDVMHHATDETERQHADDLVALLTPIIKSYGSERGFQNVSEAMQVTGGAGFTQDWPIEQYLRDVRIAMIYEGTNHIQALDLVGRKLPMHGGRLMQAFASEVSSLIRATSGDPRMEPFTTPLKQASKKLNEVTMALAGQGMQDAEVLGAVSSNYLNLFALVTLAYVWVRQVHAVIDRADDDTLKRNKLQTARFFFELVLPEAELYARKVAVGKAPITEFDVALLG
jgi:alkylation response protein AidB-like acyl-CoA dehydrogenase